MGFRVNGNAVEALEDLAGKRVEFGNLLHFVAEQFHPDGCFFRIRRVDVYDIATHPESATLQFHVIARILYFSQFFQQATLIDNRVLADMQHHGMIRLGVAQTVDRGHGGDNNGVIPLQQRLGGGQAHLFDVLVDGCIFFDEGIRSRHIGFRLVIVVIGNKILHCIVGKKIPHLRIQLRRQRLVVRHYQGRTLHALDHIGHGKGLAGAGYAQQGLPHFTVIQALHQPLDGFGLVSGGLICAF